MTTTTSRRSAKATPKPEPEPGINGTPTEETEPESESTSTTWTIETTGGMLHEVILAGSGRISFGNPRGTGEVRIYRNATTKVFDAVLTDVKLVYSDKAIVVSKPLHGVSTKIGKSPGLSSLFAPTSVAWGSSATLSADEIDTLATAIATKAISVEPEDD